MPTEWFQPRRVRTAGVSLAPARIGQRHLANGPDHRATRLGPVDPLRRGGHGRPRDRRGRLGQPGLPARLRLHGVRRLLLERVGRAGLRGADGYGLDRRRAAPGCGGIAKTTIENTELDFTAADFTAAYSDADPNDALQTVRITALPSQGQLSLDGTPVTAGEEISLNDLSGLAYLPNSAYTGTDAFSWTASDGLTYAANAATVSISVQAGGPTVDLGPADATGTPTLDFTATFIQGDASGADRRQRRHDRRSGRRHAPRG